eukprot:365393-Chlamydomonas_euryale.AAC.3
MATSSWTLVLTLQESCHLETVKPSKLPGTQLVPVRPNPEPLTLGGCQFRGQDVHVCKTSTHETMSTRGSAVSIAHA